MSRITEYTYFSYVAMKENFCNDISLLREYKNKTWQNNNKFAAITKIAVYTILTLVNVLCFHRIFEYEKAKNEGKLLEKYRPGRFDPNCIDSDFLEQLTFFYKNIGHAFETKLKITPEHFGFEPSSSSESSEKINIEGWYVSKAKEAIIEAIKSFIAKSKDSTELNGQDFKEILTYIKTGDACEKRPTELLSQIQSDDDFVIWFDGGYTTHAVATVILKQAGRTFILRGNRGYDKDHDEQYGILVAKFDPKNLDESKLKKLISGTKEDFATIPYINEALECELELFAKMKQQIVGNCTYSSMHMLFAIMLIVNKMNKDGIPFYLTKEVWTEKYKAIANIFENFNVFEKQNLLKKAREYIQGFCKKYTDGDGKLKESKCKKDISSIELLMISSCHLIEVVKDRLLSSSEIEDWIYDCTGTLNKIKEDIANFTSSVSEANIMNEHSIREIIKVLCEPSVLDKVGIKNSIRRRNYIDYFLDKKALFNSLSSYF